MQVRCKRVMHVHTNNALPLALWSMPFQFSQAKEDFYSSKKERSLFTFGSSKRKLRVDVH